MSGFKAIVSSLVCLVLVTSSSLVLAETTKTNDAGSENESRETTYNCVGTYIFSNVTRKDYLQDFLVIKWKNRDEIYLSVIPYGFHNAKDSYGYLESNIQISESDNQFIGTKTDDGDRYLVRFDKKSKRLLFVINFSNGSTNKYDGQCF
jgi:hypothetical protein